MNEGQINKKNQKLYFHRFENRPILPYKLFYYIYSNKVTIYRNSRSASGETPYKRIFLEKFPNFQNEFLKNQPKMTKAQAQKFEGKWKQVKAENMDAVSDSSYPKI